MKETLAGKVHSHFSPVYPAFLLGVSAGYCYRALVDESEMITAQMGKKNRSVMVTVCGMPCTVPPANSNSTFRRILLLDFIHRPLFFHFKNNVSEAGSASVFR
jgi:hypothetical protein